MPNPKTGTVTMDVAKAVEDIKKGKVEYRVDKEGNINLMIGKVSFDDEKLVDNFNALLEGNLKSTSCGCKGYLHQKPGNLHYHGTWCQSNC